MGNLFSKLRVLVAIIAIALTVIFAFTPLLNFSLTNSNKVENDMKGVVYYAKLAEKLKEGKIDEEKYKGIDEYFLQEEYNVQYSIISFIKEIPNTIKVYKAYSDIEKREDIEVDLETSFGNHSQEYIDNLRDQLKESDEKIKEIDYNAVTIESLDQFRWCVTGFGSLDLMEGNLTVVDMIAMAIASIIKFALAALLIVLFPIVMVFTAIKLLGAVIKKDNNKIMSISRETFSWTALLLATSAVWNANLTDTGVLLVIVTAIVIVFNIVSSWLVSNTERNAKILASTQICSFISVIGIAMLISNVVKADLGSIWNVLLELDATLELEASLMTASLFLSVLALFMPIAYTGIVSLMARAGNVDLGISGKKKLDGGIGLSIIFGIAVLVFNVYVRNKYAMEMTEAQSSAVVMAWVGIGLTILGSIALSVAKSALKNK